MADLQGLGLGLAIGPLSQIAPRELTKEELDAISEAFALFDRHGNQTVANAEVGTVMRVLGRLPSQAELRDIIKLVDVTDSGYIEYRAFVDLMSRLPWGDQGCEAGLVDAFVPVFDRAGSGRVSAAEMRRVLTTLGEPVTDDEMNVLIGQLDMDGVGSVSVADVIKTIMKVK